MFQHEVKLRVRYADTDQMGFVYYGNYAAFYEVARVESFRNLGFSYKNLESSGVGMPVLHMQSSYHAPARYDDLLKIIIRIPEMPRARIHYEYEIYNEDLVKVFDIKNYVKNIVNRSENFFLIKKNKSS